jgi:L,D-transpeptidase-like protein/putative peptidoglycan binding protein
MGGRATPRTAAVVVAILALVAIAAACAGAGSGRSGPPAGTSPTGPAPSSPLPAELRAYLGQVRPEALVTTRSARAAVSMITTLRRHPSADQRQTAVQALHRAVLAYRRSASRLASITASGRIAKAALRLSRSSSLASRGLQLVARGVAHRLRGAMRAGRKDIGRAAHAALAWQGLMLRLAARRHVPVPGWLDLPARTLQKLLHAADARLAAPLEPGSTGTETAMLQERLADLGYLPVGYRTGTYDYRTLQAVIAFQGWEGLSRDGVAGPRTLQRLQDAGRPRAWSTSTRHLELHVAQQVLLLVEGGRVVRAIHVSTAAPGHVTPTGTFAIYRKERMSWSVPFQVWMPYASYFTGGYALHEYPDVPPYPASHGCVRVPAGDSLVVWEFASIGTPIVIA